MAICSSSSSKKAKKEAPEDSGCGSPEMESELPSEDDSRYPEDLEDRMKSEWAGGLVGGSEVRAASETNSSHRAAFNNLRLQGKKTVVEKLAEVVDTLKKGGSASDPAQQLAAILFLAKLLEEKSSQEKNSARSDSAQSLR